MATPVRRATDLDTLADMEKDYILRILDHADGNQSEAARIVGIGRSTLKRKLKLYGTGNSPGPR